ncbi:MAG: hypothetical protein ACI9TH_000415 [Kiritimatiellia bacterium]|jgi:hypothetical protein
MKTQMMKKTLVTGLLLMLGMTLCSCETVNKRIKSNQVMFDAWPLETRSEIQQGRVKVGFDKDMVLVALGQPQRVKKRSTEAGESEVWSYLGTRSKLVYVDNNLYATPVYCPPTTKGGRGRYRYVHQYYAPVTQYETYETKRVVFSEGKVTEIEALN